MYLNNQPSVHAIERGKGRVFFAIDWSMLKGWKPHERNIKCSEMNEREQDKLKCIMNPSVWPKKKNKFKCNWGHWSIHYNVLIDECANSQIESAKVT